MNTPATATPRAKSLALLVYVLYVFCFFWGISAVVGVIIAHLNQSSTLSWVNSHSHYQIRTFWGGSIVLFISIIASFMGTGLIQVCGLVMLSLVLSWMLVRLIRGVYLLTRSAPHPNPRTWLI